MHNSDCSKKNPTEQRGMDMSQYNSYLWTWKFECHIILMCHEMLPFTFFM